MVQLGDFGFWSDKKARHTPVLDEHFLDAVVTDLARYGVWVRFVDGDHDAHPFHARALPPLVLPDGAGLGPLRPARLHVGRRVGEA